MSEQDLRLQIVIPVLRATPGITNVTDVHGQNERGLDVIFFVESPIEQLCYGLQLKRGAISGGGTGNKTVKQIVDQLELAKDFDHPVATKNAGTYQIDKFVVCTNGGISITAREEIARRLVKIPVLYWDRDELVRRIHMYLPQLFHVADGGAVEYLNAAMAKAETLDSLDQIPGVAKRSLSQVFIEPHLRRKFDPAIGSSATNTATNTEPAMTALASRQHIVLVADQDAGKTALLRYVVIKTIRSLLTGQAGTKAIPILIRAKDILARGLSVKDAIAAELAIRNGEALKASLDEDLAAGQYGLAIDGFSEFLREEDKDLVAGLIERFCEDFPNVAVIVAARPVDFLRAKYLPHFCQYSIEEWAPAQVTALVRAWTGDSITYADVADKMIDRLRQALQLPGSPIPAMIGVMLHEEQGKFMTNTAEAIDKYMVIRLGRYAHELGMRQEIDWTKKQDFLSEVAFQMVSEEKDSISVAELTDAFDVIYKRQGDTPKGALLVNELLESGVLSKEGDQLGFHRTSFRDFFAAKHLIQVGEVEAFATTNLYARNWGSVLVFAAGLRRRNSNLLNQVAANVNSFRDRSVGGFNDDYFYASYLCGRILSNSEGSDADPRIAALITFVRGASDALPELESVAEEQFGNIGNLLALLGIEQTVFTTIGVPWLENQLKIAIEDETRTEEERYMLASTYSHLGCTNCCQVLRDLTPHLKQTRTVFALDLLIQQLERARNLAGEEAAALESLKTFVRRKLHSRRDQVHALLETKSHAFEMERKRIKRIQGKARRGQKGN